MADERGPFGADVVEQPDQIGGQFDDGVGGDGVGRRSRRTPLIGGQT